MHLPDKRRLRTWAGLLGAVCLMALLLSACAAPPQELQEPRVTAEAAEGDTGVFERSPDVPELPFADNPDPLACGIPTPWGQNNQAWLTGMYEGELIQPIVFLYDSHLRLGVRAQAAHGTEVEVILFQNNPALNYYMVRIPGAEPGKNEGWVPEPFLSFEPVEPLDTPSD